MHAWLQLWCQQATAYQAYAASFASQLPSALLMVLRAIVSRSWATACSVLVRSVYEFRSQFVLESMILPVPGELCE